MGYLGKALCLVVLAQVLVGYSASGAPLSDSEGNVDREAMLGQHQRGDEHNAPWLHARLPSGDPAASPEQIHIALAASDSPEEYAVTVAWATWPETRSQVVWGSDDQRQDNIAYGRATSECHAGLSHSVDSDLDVGCCRLRHNSRSMMQARHGRSLPKLPRSQLKRPGCCLY